MVSLNNKIESSYSELYSVIKQLGCEDGDDKNSIFDKIGFSIETLTSYKLKFEELAIRCHDLEESREIIKTENNKLREDIENLKSDQTKYEELVTETVKKTEL